MSCLGESADRVSRGRRMNPSAQFCEVKVDGAWGRFGVDEAQQSYRDELKRCISCHGRVVILGSYGMQRRMTLSHRRAHDGCSSIQKRYLGVPRQHPEALE